MIPVVIFFATTFVIMCKFARVNASVLRVSVAQIDRNFPGPRLDPDSLYDAQRL